jgi:hypothetical protein
MERYDSLDGGKSSRFELRNSGGERERRKDLNQAREEDPLL